VVNYLYGNNFSKGHFMKKVTVVVSVFCFMGIFLLSSCGISRDEMERGIKQSFQEKMDTDSDYKKYEMKVQNISLIKSGSNSYDGFVTVLLGDETHDVSISVKTEGSSYMWETKPLAFGFLMQ
jgi:predicted small secreted protein